MTERIFSIFSRQQAIDSISEQEYDLTVIGGGITGAGIALDAASRGLNVLLLEKGDFASGTSSKSTKLIHGGLRYLMQFEFGLVKETGTERAVVHKLAPHLAIPEKMLLPFVTDGTYGHVATSVGLKVYDILADVVKKDRRQMLSRIKTLAAEPMLNKEIVEGGGIYSEYRTDDARLTIEVLKTAHRYESNILNYAEVTAFTREGENINGIVFRDHISGKDVTAKSKVVVAATGPWLDRLLQKKEASTPNKLRLTKGVHLVVPHDKFPLNQSVYFDTPDERMIFAIPRGKTTYIGTTDTEFKGDPDRVVATVDDARYLIGALSRVFPTLQLRVEDIISSWAGLRPLIEEEGKAPSELSRKDEIYELEDGLIAIAGGKLTGYRRMAERVVDLAQERLQLPHKIRCRTLMIPLTEAPFTDYNMVKKAIRHYYQLVEKDGMEAYFGWYLISNYGSNAAKIWRKYEETGEKGETGLIKAEVWYTVMEEMTTSLTDFFVRRTGRLYFDIDSIKKHKSAVSSELADHLKWNKSEIEKQNLELDKFIADATTFYDSESPGG